MEHVCDECIQLMLKRMLAYLKHYQDYQKLRVKFMIYTTIRWLFCYWLHINNLTSQVAKDTFVFGETIKDHIYIIGAIKVDKIKG